VKQKRINGADDCHVWIGWIRPAVGVSATWRPWVASEDEDLCRDLVRDHAPPGCHTCCLPAGRQPFQLVQEDYAE
jgi:hypothetical protein